MRVGQPLPTTLIAPTVGFGGQPSHRRFFFRVKTFTGDLYKPAPIPSEAI